MRKSRSEGCWVSACKVCSLFKTHPDLWVHIHTKVLKENIPRTNVIDWANLEITKLNAKLPPDSPKRLAPFNVMNFQVHFKGQSGSKEGHLTDFHKIQFLLNKERSKARIDGEEVHSFLEDDAFHAAEILLNKVNRELTEYTALSKMVYSLEQVMDTYDTSLQEKIRNGDRISLNHIEQYQKQVSSLMKLKTDLASLRNKSEIVGQAIHDAFSISMIFCVEQMASILTEAKHQLKAEMPNSNLAEDIFNNISKQMVEAIKGGGESIVDQIYNKYNLKKK